MTTNEKVRIAIIGGGPAGVMTAIQAIERLASQKPVEILMFEQSKHLGGAPWIHSGQDTRTNIPVWGISIYLGDPFGNDFKNWIETTDRSNWREDHRNEVFTGESFPPRYIVGQYILDRFHEAISRTEVEGGDRRHIKFSTYSNSEVTALDPNNKTLTFENGTELVADLFVLSVGPGPLNEPDLITDVIGTPGYVVPFTEDGMQKVEDIAPEEDLLILGSGQTACDIAKLRYLQLQTYIESGETANLGKITFISRNGAMHRPYSEERPFPRKEQYRNGKSIKTSELLEQIRSSDNGGIDLEKFFAFLEEQYEEVGESGIANIEGSLPEVWKKLTPEQREELLENKRFLTIARTGLEPSVGKAIATLESAGMFEIKAAELKTVSLDGDIYTIETEAGEVLTGTKLINALGTDHTKMPRIYQDLIENGHARIHPPTELGIDAKSRHGGILSKTGEVSEAVFVVGGARLGQVFTDTGILFGPSQGFSTIRSQASRVGSQLMIAAAELAKNRESELPPIPQVLQTEKIEVQGQRCISSMRRA